ncbi:MAG: lysophospholipid acyltransferase family protein [Clostridia bacterium]
MKKNKKSFMQVENVDQNIPMSSDEHVIKFNHLKAINFDENYEYVIKNPVKRFFMRIVWGIAVVVFYIGNTCAYSLKIKGKKNLKAIKKSKKGAISVCNHCMILDCTMAQLATFRKKIYLPTVQETCQIPVVRRFVRCLNAVPIPRGIKPMKVFMDDINKLLQDGNFIHFYPEASLWPWYDKLRPFKTGCFKFAVDNDVAVVPMALTFRDRNKWWKKIISRRPMVTLTVLEPIFPNKELPKKQCVLDLANRAHQMINEQITNNPYHTSSSPDYTEQDEKSEQEVVQKFLEQKKTFFNQL